MMVPKAINVLQSHVVDQIAAGEVVERPSHLVKELVENSIDAGAREIEVEFDYGGRYVRVVDDGAGIVAEDLPKALARHATSKIQAADEIWSLQSFGFRGEALASIAAVSRLELQSRPRTSEKVSSGSASKIESDFGRIGEVMPSSGNFGTVVKISELFENVPARLKFMKSEVAEGAQIKNVLRAIAISHPSVGIRLRSKAQSGGSTGAKPEFAFKKGEDFLARCQTALGVKLHLAEGEFEGIEVKIAFSGPQDVTGNSKGLWFFVQDRWIQDRSLQAAVVESYRGLLMHGEFPVAAVKLKAPNGEVDVNIHPTKSAVKFRDPSRAFRAVARTLRSALEKAPWLDGSAKSGENTPSIHPAMGTSSGISRGSASASGAVQSYSVKDFSRPYQPNSEVVTPASLSFEFSSSDLLKTQVKEKTFPVLSVNTGVGVWSRLDVIGQADQTYIVCQEAGKIVFIDQHAAHERVAFERLMRAWKAKGQEGKLETQSLLIPILINIEDDQLEALMKHQSDLHQIGFSIEQVGPRTVAVQELPVILKEAVVAKALKDVASASLDRGGSFLIEEKIGDIFATMACHSVVRAGQTLSREQMRELLNQMDEFPMSSFCPHGRPVSVEYPFSKLERDFGRTV
ncbi:MAG: DNA mismatch repair endonuclease MutL [Deltaproteobacteria bacterium]|nr:DNA mismatch repair endonuclease MutL [Deltaproteobacteria bacterium]